VEIVAGAVVVDFGPWSSATACAAVVALPRRITDDFLPA
jgi:hypothetical protein